MCVSMYYVYENGCCTCYIYLCPTVLTYDVVMVMMMEGPERDLNVGSPMQSRPSQLWGRL